MSVFGGDSWGREAQHRKRRLDDLMLQTVNENSSSSSYKKLCNGKYSCLVCPNNPVFDSSLMLSMHKKGSRHIAADCRLRGRELKRQEEIKKRIALSDNSIGNTSSGTSNQQLQLKGNPLIEQTRKAASEIFTDKRPERSATNVHDVKSASFFSPSSSSIPEQRMESSARINYGSSDSTEQARGWTPKAPGTMLAEQHLELMKHRERELKFTAAGWKRDGHGRWFRDENVEFDSDEEDPNVCLS